MPFDRGAREARHVARRVPARREKERDDDELTHALSDERIDGLVERGIDFDRVALSAIG